MFMNLAHRGASEYSPENTFSAFYKGIEHGANGIETDVKKTKDGILVLFHDSDISRVTNGIGKISDYNYKDLLQLDAGSHKSSIYKNEKIVSFEDFLKYFASRELYFAIELKDSFIEEETLQLIRKYSIEEKVTVTSFDFENLIRVRELDRKIKIGYLCEEINNEVLDKLKTIEAYQICPSAKMLTPKKVQKAKMEGFSIRAWGVNDEVLMLHALSCGVDGMTVNFPDKLTKALSM